jgi:hypothetical protein
VLYPRSHVQAGRPPSVSDMPEGMRAIFSSVGSVGDPVSYEKDIMDKVAAENRLYHDFVGKLSGTDKDVVLEVSNLRVPAALQSAIYHGMHLESERLSSLLCAAALGQPCRFWREHEAMLPIHSLVARRFFCIPLQSIKVEVVCASHIVAPCVVCCD